MLEGWGKWVSHCSACKQTLLGTARVGLGGPGGVEAEEVWGQPLCPQPREQNALKSTLGCPRARLAEFVSSSSLEETSGSSSGGLFGDFLHLSSFCTQASVAQCTIPLNIQALGALCLGTKDSLQDQTVG